MIMFRLRLPPELRRASDLHCLVGRLMQGSHHHCKPIPSSRGNNEVSSLISAHVRTDEDLWQRKC